MDNMNDLFPWDELLEDGFTEALTLNLSLNHLPPELVDLIASHVPIRSMTRFAIVNSQCRNAARRHRFGSVELMGRLFRLLPAKKTALLPNAEAPIEDILAGSRIKGCRVMRELLADEENIKAIRDFRIESAPEHSLQPYFIRFIKHIWDKAPFITSIEHTYFPIKLPAPCWPDTLTSMNAKHVCWWVLKGLEGKAFRHLALTSCTGTTTKLLDHKFAHVTRFEYLWHDWKEEVEMFNFDWIAQAFPQLRTLKIGVCSCTVDRNVPEKFYLGAICKLISNLEHLDTLTLRESRCRGDDGEQAVITALEDVRPILQTVNFEWLSGDHEDNIYKESSWWRHGPMLIVPYPHIKTPKPKQCDTRWTPDPTRMSRLPWWWKRYGFPGVARLEMVKLWPGLTPYLPSEDVLDEHFLRHIKAEVLKEGKCTWQSTGTCNCVLCTF